MARYAERGALPEPDSQFRNVDPTPGRGGAALDLGTFAIVFCDIDNSRRRAVELGAERWIAALDVHNTIVRRQLARHNGSEIAAEADGFILRFSSAGGAVSFMVDLQRAVSALARSRPADGWRVGSVLTEANRSATTTFVSRRVVADSARGGEILVSEAMRALVEPKGDFRFGPVRVVTLEGLSGEQLVHPVEWEDPID